MRRRWWARIWGPVQASFKKPWRQKLAEKNGDKKNWSCKTFCPTLFEQFSPHLVEIFFFYLPGLIFLPYLVDDNSIAATVRNLAHAAIGDPSKLEEKCMNMLLLFLKNLMTSCSCLAVLTELVEQQKDNRVAILVMILVMMTMRT